MPEIEIDIVHFDDEINTVSSIPNSLLNYFQSHHDSWVVEDEIVYDKFVRSFLLQPNDRLAVRVRYELTDDFDNCIKRLDAIDPNTGIAIFDLMREKTNGGVEPIGQVLYEEAMSRGFKSERVFLLSGFPSFVDKYFKPTITVPPMQQFLKPISATEVAQRLATLLPIHASA